LSSNNELASSSKKIGGLIPYFAMAIIILAVQVGSLWLTATDYIPSQPPIDTPENVLNSVYYIIILVAFSAVIIYLIK
jgi:presenilin-like A22 family membrane protease